MIHRVHASCRPSRVAGGPNGGPLFNVHGRDIDMFFLPLGVRPGSVLEVGDVFRLAGPIMPTLPSKVEYTVTAPDGTLRKFEGRANAIGYYYDPADDFKLDQPGLWAVELIVIHDGMTSAGPVQEPYPNGGPLTPDGRTFTFVVTDNGTKALDLVTDLTRRSPLLWYAGAIHNARFEALLPQGWTGETAHLTVTMPGITLVENEIRIEDGVIRWLLKGEEMNQLANNFDYDAGLADTITVTYCAEEQSGRQAAGTIVAHGARVPLAPPFIPSAPIGPPGRPTAYKARPSFSPAILRKAQRDGTSAMMRHGLLFKPMAQKCSRAPATFTHTQVTTGTK